MVSMKHILNYRLFESNIELSTNLMLDITLYSRDPKFSTEDLTQIIDSTDPNEDSQVLNYVAAHPNLSQEDQTRLLKMSQDSEYGFRIKYGLCKNPNLNRETIDTLMNDSSEVVRGHLAKNEKIDADTAGILSRDPDWFVRSMVALNPVLRTRDLYPLTRDDKDNVRDCAEFSMRKRDPMDELLGDF